MQIGLFSQDLGLTHDEKAWLNKHRNRFIYAPAPSWPPGEYMDENGEHQGIISEYIKLFEQRLGLKFKIAAYTDWDNVVNALKKEDVDFIGGIQETPERDSFFYFTKPFLKLSFVILVRKNYAGSLTPENIGTMKLAGVKNYTTTEFIKTKYHNEKIQECPDDLTALLQTSLGNTDGTIIDLMTASYLVQKYGINNLSVGRNIDFSWELSFACGKENKELSSILDKLLASIDEQQRNEIYSKWVNITIPEKTYIEKHTQLIIISGGILLLLLIFIIPYNVVLRRQVKKKTSDLNHELEEKNHAIQLLHKNEMRLESLFTISQLKTDSIENLLDHSLKEAVRLTDSKRGILYFYNEKDGSFSLSNYFDIDETGSEKIILNEKIGLAQTGYCGDIIRRKIAFLTNPHQTCNKCQVCNCIFMPGIVDHSLFIPVIDDNDEFVAILSVANKETEYNKSDARQLSLLFNSVWKLLNKQRWQEQLIAAKEKAEEGDRLKSAFLANMSHEIRTPMNGIVGFASFLLNEELTGEQIAKYSSIIIKSSNQLLNIVNDILEISRLETNQVKISYSEFELKGVFTEITALFKSQAIEKKLVFSVDLPVRKRFMITSDETKLKQILFNLLGNALKFTEKGKIETGFQFEGDFLKFYVKDTGIGIDPNLQEAIFERFRQADVSTSRLYGGTGLGLSISKAFVELLGGRIWVESEPSRGSAFYFTIPYLASESQIQGDLSEPEEETFDFPMSTILIAEDEEANQYYLQVILEHVNVNIIMVGDGSEAVEVIKENPAIDLALLDIKMPVMDGLEAARMIKALRPGLPLIAQTAFSQPDEHEKATKAGFDEFITKPIHKENLLKMIASYLIKK